MKKIIPPYLLIICAFSMIMLHRFYPVGSILQPPFNFLGVILILLGLLIPVSVRRQFTKKNTEIHTFKKPSKLVIDGLFTRSRNPIYVGFVICLLGVWLVLGTISPISGPILFIIITHFGYIPYEEKCLEQIFGRSYVLYKTKVRRWI